MLCHFFREGRANIPFPSVLLHGRDRLYGVTPSVASNVLPGICQLGKGFSFTDAKGDLGGHLIVFWSHVLLCFSYPFVGESIFFAGEILFRLKLPINQKSLRVASNNPTDFENLDIMLDWVYFCQVDSGESIKFVPTNWYNLYWVLCEPFLLGKFLWGLFAGVYDSVRVMIEAYFHRASARISRDAEAH